MKYVPSRALFMPAAYQPYRDRASNSGGSPGSHGANRCSAATRYDLRRQRQIPLQMQKLTRSTAVPMGTLSLTGWTRVIAPTLRQQQRRTYAQLSPQPIGGSISSVAIATMLLDDTPGVTLLDPVLFCEIADFIFLATCREPARAGCLRLVILHLGSPS